MCILDNHGGQKRALDPLGLELQVVLCYLCVGNEPRSSGRTASLQPDLELSISASSIQGLGSLVRTSTTD